MLICFETNHYVASLFTSMSELEEVLASFDPSDGSYFKSEQKSCERYNDLVSIILLTGRNWEIKSQT